MQVLNDYIIKRNIYGYDTIDHRCMYVSRPKTKYKITVIYVSSKKDTLENV